jgi:KTSC domain-containing protein
MKRNAVISSLFASVGFSADSNTLEVEFVDGKIYRYFAVPERVYLEFMQAGSKGNYFREHIRDKYPYKRIRWE